MERPSQSLAASLFDGEDKAAVGPTTSELGPDAPFWIVRRFAGIGIGVKNVTPHSEFGVVT